MKSSDIKDLRLLRRYKNWLSGHGDRLERKPCASTNGDYLDGWYSPEKDIPDFLTHSEAAILRRVM